jgi:type II secretion system protein G
MSSSNQRARRSLLLARRRGFSLIEIMIVLVIIGIMAGAVTLATTHWIDKARTNRARSDIGNYITALNAFRAEKDRYPSSDEGLGVLAPTYVEKIANDPWNRPHRCHQFRRAELNAARKQREQREQRVWPAEASPSSSSWPCCC